MVPSTTGNPSYWGALFAASPSVFAGDEDDGEGLIALFDAGL